MRLRLAHEDGLPRPPLADIIGGLSHPSQGRPLPSLRQGSSELSTKPKATTSDMPKPLPAPRTKNLGKYKPLMVQMGNTTCGLIYTTGAESERPAKDICNEV